MKSGKSLLLAIVLLGMALVPAYAATPNIAVIFHDAFMTYDDIRPDVTIPVGIYQQDVTPWMDVLIQLEDGKWYGPERNDDDKTVEPLPEGYHWEFVGGFSGTPGGEMWWNGAGPEGEARLLAGDDSVLVAVPVRIELHIPGTSDGGAVLRGVA